MDIARDSKHYATACTLDGEPGYMVAQIAATGDLLAENFWDSPEYHYISDSGAVEWRPAEVVSDRRYSALTAAARASLRR